MKKAFPLLCLLLATSLTACQADGPLATQIADSNTQIAQTATAYSTDVSVLSTDTPTATATLTPTSSIAEVTRGAPTTPVPHIIEVNIDEVEWLAALCWVEVRSFGEARPGACASVVDTVMTRIRRLELSDGTVYGTITWGCDADTEACQFPRWVIDGCEGIVIRACPFYDSEGMIYFRGIVLGYLTGDIAPTCPNRLYYGLKSFDLNDCVITAPSGAREGWHN